MQLITIDLDVNHLKVDFDGKAEVLFDENLKSGSVFSVRFYPAFFNIDAIGT